MSTLDGARPYYEDEDVTLYCGDSLVMLDGLADIADCIVTDPPYGQTDASWDVWQDRWPSAFSLAARSMWTFGTMRMFLDHRDDFYTWQFSQDVIWSKGDSTSFVTDRFRRAHEIACHFYRGAWADIYHKPPREKYYGGSARGRELIRPAQKLETMNKRGSAVYADDGTRLPFSVIDCPRVTKPRHVTEKPVGVLAPLIEYACPPGGTVLDPFAGSGSTGEAARLSGRKAILIESNESFCAGIEERMRQGILSSSEGASI